MEKLILLPTGVGAAQADLLFMITANSNVLTQLLRISGSGNVGIGTFSPTDKLSVNGNIRAHEVKVETINWPDYVFEKNYQLQSLSILEQYLLKNKHLTDMPSSEQIEVSGQNLGQVNASLLKNLEELTLHLIAKNKQISALEAVTEKQQEEINLLKKGFKRLLEKSK